MLHRSFDVRRPTKPASDGRSDYLRLSEEAFVMVKSSPVDVSMEPGNGRLFSTRQRQDAADSQLQT